MKFQQLLILSIIAATLALVAGHVGGHVSVQDIKPKFYCGYHLANMLAMLCNEENSENTEKRSGMYNTIPSYYNMPEEMNWPWLAPHKARAANMPSRGKRDRGIVSECCEKACSVDELLSYC